MIIRRTHTALLCGALLAGLAACASPAEDSSASSADGGDPVVVEHQFGSTEIIGVPQRIVTIDVQWTDTLLALDVDPVGYTVAPTGTYPWQELPESAAVIELGGDYSIPVEQVAALRPDLIVASESVQDRATYDLLADIAPTIPNLDDRAVTPWQDIAAVAGRVLDREDDAAALVAEVDGQVAGTAAELPGLTGKTFALAQYVVGDQLYIVSDEADGASTFFQDLGMQLLPAIVAQGEADGTPQISASVERADLLGADLLTFLVNGGDESALADIPGFDQLPGTVALVDFATIVGFRTPTPLSVPYCLDVLRPSLVAVAA